jgi:hypothetical protein
MGVRADQRRTGAGSARGLLEQRDGGSAIAAEMPFDSGQELGGARRDRLARRLRGRPAGVVGHAAQAAAREAAGQHGDGGAVRARADGGLQPPLSRVAPAAGELGDGSGQC